MLTKNANENKSNFAKQKRPMIFKTYQFFLSSFSFQNNRKKEDKYTYSIVIDLSICGYIKNLFTKSHTLNLFLKEKKTTLYDKKIYTKIQQQPHLQQKTIPNALKFLKFMIALIEH